MMTTTGKPWSEAACEMADTGCELGKAFGPFISGKDGSKDYDECVKNAQKMCCSMFTNYSVCPIYQMTWFLVASIVILVLIIIGIVISIICCCKKRG